MSIIKEEYQELPPHGNRLADIVVLAQAWKKSHTYIRRHNWYADVLELDASTVDLENSLEVWAANVCKEDFQTNDLLLVPAPKNARWWFHPQQNLVQIANGLFQIDLNALQLEATFEDWGPAVKEQKETAGLQSEAKSQSQKMRPLAHLSIRDQTLATSLMMCLAEIVESAQGDPSSTDLLEMRTQGTVSYGNRLHCTWSRKAGEKPRARFSWGNSQTYRQYFQDYRTFLARPRRVCAALASQLAPRRELFVVSLDIKSFFDRVEPSALLRELITLENEHRDAFGIPINLAADNEFWQRAARIISWKWRPEDHKMAELILGDGVPELELGLPQGLVASGFFANAYMVRFDRKMQEASLEGAAISETIKLLDYCRYVDDMRLVVEADSGSSVLEKVKDYAFSFLKEHCSDIGAKKVLELSPDKCDATSFREISAKSDVSALMEMLNAELSGTFDLESLVQASGGLDGLLRMSDHLDSADKPKPSRLSLATVAAPTTDVRDDTVKRFVASRISQLMRQRLAMTDKASLTGSADMLSNHVTQGAVISHEFESTARKLIRYWAENPALVLLLRCGLDLFPHPRLLTPVAEALCTKLFNTPADLDTAKQKEVRVAEYVLADLLRAGASETGFRSAEEYPEGIDIPSYREDLGALARRVLTEREASPWYLRQQARLYLASQGDNSLARTPELCPEAKSYAALQSVSLYEPLHGNELKDALPLALVAQHLQPNARRFGTWFSEGLNRTEDAAIRECLVRTVSLNNPELMKATVKGRRASGWRQFVPTALLRANRRTRELRRAAPQDNSVQSLLDVINQPSNLFDQENALLMLAAALLRQPNIEVLLSSGLSANEIRLQCKDWSQISALPDDPCFLQMEPVLGNIDRNPLYENPAWVSSDKAWLYGLGRILRSALTGEFDFTSRRFLITEDFGGYGGIHTSWAKRRFGLVNSGSGLLDEPGPVSPWLSGLLSTLLQWPGVEFRAHAVAAAAASRTSNELLALIQNRITAQRALYGSRSNTPIYVVPVDDQEPLVDRPLRVAIVQPLRPRRSEFDTKDPTHWTEAALAQHRRHLAEVCRLTHQQLKAWAAAGGLPSTKENSDGPVVDIVLFPELSIHPEHVFLLRRLSDKLQSNIFAGLTFLHSEKAGGTVNQGLWLIRTRSSDHGRAFQYIWQGKHHPMKIEEQLGIKGHRPHLTLVELPIGAKTRTRIAAAICYDATDLDLVADLRDRSDMFLVAALNQDVQTFDNMIAALHFHMYQPVVLANSGEFGGSTAQVPLPKHERLIAHMHGNQQVAVSVFEVDPSIFKSTSVAKSPITLKSPPAGYKGRPK